MAGEINHGEVRRTISPYDLTSADNPGAIISLPLLNGRNYDEWARGLRTALLSRKKFGFLDGTIAKPATDSTDYDDWVTIQALLVSWIRMTIEPNLRSSISHRDVAADLWEYLKRRFSVVSGSRLQQLKYELANCKQKGSTVEAYFGRMNKLWDSLEAHRPLRLCRCGGCQCDVAALQESDREEDKIHQFLFGLDEQFRAVRSSLVSRSPLQSMEEIYSIIRQEEDFKTVIEETPQTTAFVAQSKVLSKFEKDKMYCKICNRSGHMSEKCFTIVGYPDWWGDRPKTRNNVGRGRGLVSAQGRGQSGPTYSSREDRVVAQGRGQIRPTFSNRVVVPHIEQVTHETNHVITDSERDKVKLTDQQWEAIKSILNAGTNKETAAGKSKIKLTWIMDTGASHHLTGRFDSLFNIREMSPVLIIMPDGREIISRTEGSVYLGPKLIMKSVYFVKELKSDLISLGQLMDENQCVMQMADSFIVVQDRITRMVIGLGKRVGGTYHFRETEFVRAVQTRSEKNMTCGTREWVMLHPQY